MAVEATNETESAAESQELDREVLLTVYRRRPRGVAGEEAQGESRYGTRSVMGSPDPKKTYHAREV